MIYLWDLWRQEAMQKCLKATVWSRESVMRYLANVIDNPTKQGGKNGGDTVAEGNGV